MPRIVDPDTGEVLDPRETPEYYTMEQIRNADVWTPKAIRDEYTRLRKIAISRLSRIAESEYADSETYRRNINQYKPVSELSPGELKSYFYNLSRMIGAETGSLTGLRRADARRVETLQDRGYEFVNRKNVRQFGEFMEEWRVREELKGFSSEQVAELYGETIRRKIPPEKIQQEFEYWLENQDEMERMPRRVNKKPVSSEDLKDMIDREKKRRK